MNHKMDEYPATPPELGTFWTDCDDFLYFCYDYDHLDHCVYMIGVENKYSDKAPRHNGWDYAEELFHFDNLYKEQRGTKKAYKALIDALPYDTFLNFWDILNLPEGEKRLILLGKSP